MISRFRLAAALIALCAVAAVAPASEPAWRARLAVAPDGGVVGGWQTEPGTDGEFSLFSVNPADGKAGGLGRFNGQLAGIAAPPGGGALALTSDGSLGLYTGEFTARALPDDRWNMLDLTLFRGEPVALHYELGGALHLVRLGEDRAWMLDETVAARDDGVAKAVLLPLGDDLHLFWLSRDYGLSKGMIRHTVLRDARWTEQASIPTGDLQSFCAFADGGAPVLAAVAPDPLGAGKKELIFLSRSGDQWTAADPGRAGLAERLFAHPDFAAVAAADGPVWLYAGRRGATLSLPSGEQSLTSPGDPDAAAALPGLLSLGLLVLFFVLLGVYARRSRMLSRLHPGRPSDLISRGVALLIDWVLVSVGMTAYHYAAGDALVLERLTTGESVNRLFWINLAAFALYAAVLEGRYGFTPGKYLCGLRVRSLLGGPPGFFQAGIRNAMRAIDMFPLAIAIPGFVGMVAALLNRRRQRIGDSLAATVVLRHAPVRGRRFLLASASPRRLELMQAMGLDVTVRPADIDEEAIRGEDPEHTARLLAEAKASAIASQMEERNDMIVVAADTMVVLDGEILGKPADAAGATRMLERLSGRSHTVVTGVTVWDALTGQGLSDVEVTEVEFRVLSPREIETYVATGDPMDKAGAYGIQSGSVVKQVRGSLSNVAGLPMEKLQRLLYLLDS